MRCLEEIGCRISAALINLVIKTVVFGEAHSCAGKRKVFSSELMLLSLKIINLKGSCFWLGENIEFYNENSNFGKTHFSLERVDLPILRFHGYFETRLFRTFFLFKIAGFNCMSMQGTWADHIVIQAIADTLNLKIHFVESSENFADITSHNSVYRTHRTRISAVPVLCKRSSSEIVNCKSIVNDGERKYNDVREKRKQPIVSCITHAYTVIVLFGVKLCLIKLPKIE